MSFAFMPVFTGDYLRDTRHLSPMKHGIYFLLLMHAWDQKGPVPLDEQECAGIANCRSADEIEALRAVLKRYWIRMEDGWYNKRMQREVERSEAISAARSSAGKKGYQAKAKQLLNNCQASASTPTPTPTTVVPTEIDASSPVGGSGGPARNKVETLSAPSGAPARRETGTAIPEDWKLPRSWGQWAIAEAPHLTPDDVRKMGEEFRDHYWANRHRKECRRADWLATWRNWVRKDHRTRHVRAGAPANLSKQAALEARNDAAGREWLARHGITTHQTDDGVIDATATERPA